jgi:DNA-directed RNA polymerase specialized sigma24 family protein
MHRAALQWPAAGMGASEKGRLAGGERTREGSRRPRDAVSVGVVQLPMCRSAGDVRDQPGRGREDDPLPTCGRRRGALSEGGLDAMRVEPVEGRSVIGQIPDRGANFLSRDSSECMGVSNGHQAGRDTTRALLEKIAGSDAAVKIRRQVIGWNPGATDEQVEDAFQEACARAEISCQGQVEGEVYAWLRTTTHRCLGRMRERVARERIAPQPLDELGPGVVAMPGPDIVVFEREKHAELQAVTRALLEHLSARQRDVAALHAHGFRRREIANRLQISERSVKRVMEQVLAIGRTELAEMAGHGCEEGHEQITRFAFGLAAPPDARRAQVHLTTCERCGELYTRLDLLRENVAAILPLPPLADGHTHIVERVVHASTELVSATPSPAAESPVGVRRHASGALGYLRDQAAAAYYRAVDPTPLAGVRPGAVAATIASCLAVTGGATYCVKQGTDPLTALTGFGGPSRHEHKSATAHHKRARAAQAPVPPVVVPTVTTTPQTVQQSAPPATTTTTAAPPPAPEDQFEPTSAAAQSQTSTATTASKPKEPAPAPTGGPGEFGGP